MLLLPMLFYIMFLGVRIAYTRPYSILPQSIWIEGLRGFQSIVSQNLSQSISFPSNPYRLKITEQNIL
jgi:hypothetical protein